VSSSVFCPAELDAAIREFWSEDQWENARRIALLESGYDPFALNDTTDADHPCGTPLRNDSRNDTVAEHSVGYFQINTCNFPLWEWQRLYNARHNAGTAHLLWVQAGGSWRPWLRSAQRLGLI
jgi:hypothetical protein